jgi:hypothetical protein
MYPQGIHAQSDNSINLMYYTKPSRMLGMPLSLYAGAEFHSYKIDKTDNTDSKTDNYVNANLKLAYYHDDNYILSAEGAYLQKVPVFTLQMAKADGADLSLLDILKGISVSATDVRIVPGLHLAKTLELSEHNALQFYQESEVITRDNYKVLLEQPWQYGKSKALVTFKPLNAHVSLANNSLAIGNTNVALSTDLGTAYLVDEPVYYAATVLGSPLPVSHPEGVLQSNFGLKCAMIMDSFSFKQSATLSKGWLAAHNYVQQPYEPLITLESMLCYSHHKLAASTWVNQYYQTFDNAHQYLREAVDIGAKLEYKISNDFAINGKLSNLLNKGKYIYQTIPTEPTSVAIGFRYNF